MYGGSLESLESCIYGTKSLTQFSGEYGCNAVADDGAHKASRPNQGVALSYRLPITYLRDASREGELREGMF